MRSLYVLAFLAAALTACDAARETSQITGPQADLTTWRWAEPISVVTTTDTVQTTTVVAVVGAQGGKIQNGDHILIVPKRAVTGDTEFTFTIVGGNNIHVALTAKAVSSGAVVSTFPSALTLKLNYKSANVSDPSRLVVAWLVDGTVDGAKQAMPSTVDTRGQYVNGTIPHFSDYTIGLN